MSERKDETNPNNFWITIEEIIDNCEPKPEEESHIGNTGIFKFIQVLKGSVPDMMEELSQEQKKDVVGRWWEKYSDKIIDRNGHPLTFLETWAVFIDLWPKVKYPRRETLRIAKGLARRRTDLLPEAARYGGDKGLQKLVTLCHELQELQGSDTFWITVEEAGKVLGKSAPIGSAVLKMLVKDGVLEVIKSHTSRDATRYKYIHNFTEDNEDKEDTYDIEERDR